MILDIDDDDEEEEQVGQKRIKEIQHICDNETQVNKIFPFFPLSVLILTNSIISYFSSFFRYPAVRPEVILTITNFLNERMP